MSILVAALIALLVPVQAQQTLAEMVDEAGVAWLVGEWTGETDNGETIKLSFAWDLNKRVVSLHLTTSEMESKGMIGVDPVSKEIRYVAYDNRGGSGTGVWSAVDTKAILKYRGWNPDGEPRRMGVSFAKLSADTMKLELFGLTSGDELEDTARATIQFKRKTK
jgi:hypothetical protein